MTNEFQIEISTNLDDAATENPECWHNRVSFCYDVPEFMISAVGYNTEVYSCQVAHHFQNALNRLSENVQHGVQNDGGECENCGGCVNGLDCTEFHDCDPCNC